MKRLALIMFCLSLYLPTSPSSQIIQQLATRLQSYTTLHMRFEQIYSSLTVSQPQREKGQLYYQKPGLMRWEYTSEEKRVYLIKDNLLWEYLPEENQLVIYDLTSKDFNQTLLSLLSGKLALENNYRLSLLPPTGTNFYRLHLKPLQEESEYEQIEIEVSRKNWLIHRVVFLDWAGNKTEFIFKDIKINRPLSTDIFQLKLPPDIEIIDYRKK
ncbi:MAG: hypothetical protein DRI99_08260 [Candidatus Aminicenantes bacterium]|nr:MAG: hypothetical protein DRI99_08260 [Candidatus Aminicenantes bacterium]